MLKKERGKWKETDRSEEIGWEGEIEKKES